MQSDYIKKHKKDLKVRITYTQETLTRLHQTLTLQRLQAFDRKSSYPYGISAGKICKTKFLEYKIWIWMWIWNNILIFN